jgi:hypothetical protein
LLAAKPPSKKTLGARIERLSGLSRATAEHRASDLLSWRAQLMDVVPTNIDEADDDAGASAAGDDTSTRAT